MSAPESPSALLRRAASLMRERAQKATPGPWQAHEDHGDWYVSSVEWGQVTTGINEDPSVADHVMIERDKADAEHVAGMHPLVGLALADWLDHEAMVTSEMDGYEDSDAYPLWLEGFRLPLAVARAYLGEAEGATRDLEPEPDDDDRGEFELASILAAHPHATFPEMARAVLADGLFRRIATEGGAAS